MVERGVLLKKSNMRHVILFLFLIILLSCSKEPSNEYKIYQTFDEYKMKPVAPSGRLDTPFVFVREYKNQISVIVSSVDGYSKAITYSKRNGYWYCKICSDPYETELAGYINTKEVVDCEERYIYCDTILCYSYTNDLNGKPVAIALGGSLKTKNEEIVLGFNTNIYKLREEQKFKYLRWWARNYNWLSNKNRNNKFYFVYTKKRYSNGYVHTIQCDRNTKDTTKMIIIDSYKLNSLLLYNPLPNL